MKPGTFTLPTERPVPAPPTGPFCAFPDRIAQHARQRPDAPAVITNGITTSYAALNALADRVAAAFQRDGCAPRGTISICAANATAYVAVWVGAQRAGLAVAPLAPSATPTQLRAMVADAGASHLFVDADAAQRILPVAPGVRVIRLDGGADPDGLDAWMASAGARPAPVQIAPDWTFNIIYSSGTTGTPKGIVHSNQLRWEQIWRSTSTYDQHAVTLISTPLYSNTTLVCALPTLAHGGCLILMPKFNARQYLELARQYQVTHTMLVPVQYQRLMDLPEFDDYDLRSFKYKFCTSAPFRAELKAQVLSRWPGGLIEGYGLTEGGGACSLLAHLYPNKLHTVGQPIPGSDIRLIDEFGQEVERGQTGEIVGRSSIMMQGYLHQPEKTAEIEWFDAEGHRFIRQGDVGRFDEDGFLILMDRRKDMIISGGFNIYPSDLEAEIRRDPAVADVAVVGVPSRQWGETPVAYVVPSSAAAVDAEELRQRINANLGKTQRLSAIVFIPELPRSAIGKVLKRELRDAYPAPAQTT